MATDSDWEAYLSGPAFIETIGIETFCREVNVETGQTIAGPECTYRLSKRGHRCSIP